MLLVDSHSTGLCIKGRFLGLSITSLHGSTEAHR